MERAVAVGLAVNKRPLTPIESLESYFLCASVNLVPLRSRFAARVEDRRTWWPDGQPEEA